MAKMRGKKLPIIGRIEISIVEESNPRLLAFQNGELDYVTVPHLVANALGPDNKVKPELAKQGITLDRGVQPAISYAYFNMEDPVVGGYSTEKIALRRAISMAYNVDEEIRVLRQGQGEHAQRSLSRPMSRATIRHQGQYDLRHRRRQGAARQVRLRRPRRRRLARAARWEAAHADDGLRHFGAARQRRALAAQPQCGGHQDRVREADLLKMSRYASCRCGISATSTRRPKASCRCSMGRTRASRNLRASICPSSTSSTRLEGFPTALSARSSSGSGAREFLRAVAPPTVTRMSRRSPG